MNKKDYKAPMGTVVILALYGSLGSHGVRSEIEYVMRGSLWSYIAFRASFDVSPLNS